MPRLRGRVRAIDPSPSPAALTLIRYAPVLEWMPLLRGRYAPLYALTLALTLALAVTLTLTLTLTLALALAVTLTLTLTLT